MENDSLSRDVGETNAWVGLAAVAVSVPLAIFSVPHDHTPAGALFLPALILTLGILVRPVLAAVREPVAVFRAENLVMLGLVYWLLLDLLAGAYSLEDVGRTAAQSGFVLIGLFAAGTCIAGTYTQWGLPRFVMRAAQTDWDEAYLFGAVVLCAGVTLFRFALPCGFDPVLMITSLAGNRWSAPWSRSQLGGWDAFVDHLTYFGYLLPSLTVLLAVRARKWNKPAVIVSMLLILVLTPFVAHGGSRRNLGVMFGSALLCWILLRGNTIKLRTAILCAALGALILIAMEMVFKYRAVGYAEMLSEDQTSSERTVTPSLYYLRVDDNFLRLAQIIEIVPEQHPYTYGKVFVWALIRPIPRVFWPDKPTDPGFDLASVIGARGVSLSSSVLGELYHSFGWPTVLFGGWLFGRLGGMCNRFLTDASGPVRVLMYALGAMAIFAGLRSLIELVLMSYMLLAWIVVSAIFAFFQGTLFDDTPGRANVAAGD